jgi:hypothetical protein
MKLALLLWAKSKAYLLSATGLYPHLTRTNQTMALTMSLGLLYTIFLRKSVILQSLGMLPYNVKEAYTVKLIAFHGPLHNLQKTL